jgi:anti-anti-sigma factor
MRLKTIRSDESITHVVIVGRLDVEGVNKIQYDFLHQTTSLPKPTLVDLSQVPYIASLGIGMLVSAAKSIERQGARMVLLSPQALVLKTLETAGLHEVVAIADKESAAFELLR